MTETIDSANAAASTLFLGYNGEWWDSWLIISLILVALAAIAAGITTTGSIVSHKREAASAEENLQRFKLETEESSNLLKKETARLSVEAETARKETANAQLELEKMRFPRRLNSDKLKADITGIPPQLFEVLYDQSAGDGSSLAFEIFVSLHIEGWKTDQKLPAPLTPQQGPPNLRDVWPLLPLSQQAGGQPLGISVVTKGPITDGSSAPEKVLATALLYAVSSPVQSVSRGRDEVMPEGKIRIIVGSKLP
jgi:hypothetical protein